MSATINQLLIQPIAQDLLTRVYNPTNPTTGKKLCNPNNGCFEQCLHSKWWQITYCGLHPTPLNSSNTRYYIVFIAMARLNLLRKVASPGKCETYLHVSAELLSIDKTEIDTLPIPQVYYGITVALQDNKCKQIIHIYGGNIYRYIKRGNTKK